MATYELLDQSEEDTLHAARLLNVEEKLFKRLTKRLLSPGSLIAAPLFTLPTPPPDTSAGGDEEEEGEEDNAAAKEAILQKQIERRRKWQEDVQLDFAAFDSNVVRAQLLLNSNERERRRYAQEKVRILETAQAVRDTNAALHEQLKDAQRTLELRKGYDELAEKITSNRALKPREEQHAQLEKLDAEIAELERESQEYAETWAERRDQFGRIVEEGLQMLRLIRDEKEEAERKEGMEEMETAEEREQSPSRGGTSQVGTPAGGATPAHIPEGAEKSSPSHASKLREEVMGVDVISKGDSQVASPASHVERHAQNGDAENLQMATGDGAIDHDEPRQEERGEADMDEDRPHPTTSSSDSAALGTPRMVEGEQMDTT